jgi:hypothetical protein
MGQPRRCTRERRDRSHLNPHDWKARRRRERASAQYRLNGSGPFWTDEEWKSFSNMYSHDNVNKARGDTHA